MRIRTKGRNTRIMMDFCLFSQGMSSEFAWISEIPYTMHPLTKVSNKITNFARNSLKTSFFESFLGNWREQNPSKITKNNSQGIIFVIISCQMVVALYRAMRLRFPYWFESCDANSPRNVKNTSLVKHSQEVSEYGFVYGSKRRQSQSAVDSQLRTQLRKQRPRKLF